MIGKLARQKNLYEGGIQMGKIYGYVRVSSMEQNEDRQMIALKSAGVRHKQKYNH